MKKEVSSSTEWTCFNDEIVTSIENNWFGIIEQCISLASYPTVIFYEKLNNDEQYNKSQDFNLKGIHLEDLNKKA